MSITLKNGGPAFPIMDSQTVHRAGTEAIEGLTDSAQRDTVYIAATLAAASGMTLRDYFAAQALTTCLGYEKTDIAMWVPVDFARHAYQVADAMIAERAK